MSGHHHHDHGSHGHCDDGHDHTDDITPALQTNLYQQIDFNGIVTLNEVVPRSGAAVVKKTWAQRLNEEPELESDADEQLLMYIPCVPLIFAPLYPHYKPLSRPTFFPLVDDSFPMKIEAKSLQLYIPD
jgi:hypothetical protein